MFLCWGGSSYKGFHDVFYEVSIRVSIRASRGFSLAGFCRFGRGTKKTWNDTVVKGQDQRIVSAVVVVFVVVAIAVAVVVVVVV